MLWKHFGAILSLVLVYVSVTTSRPSADQRQFEFEHNDENIEKRLSVDGRLYNPNPIGKVHKYLNSEKT